MPSSPDIPLDSSSILTEDIQSDFSFEYPAAENSRHPQYESAVLHNLSDEPSQAVWQLLNRLNEAPVTAVQAEELIAETDSSMKMTVIDALKAFAVDERVPFERRVGVILAFKSRGDPVITQYSKSKDLRVNFSAGHVPLAERVTQARKELDSIHDAELHARMRRTGEQARNVCGLCRE